MSRKRWGVFLILGGVFLLHCVSPFYGTARIQEGHHVDFGISASSHVVALGEWAGHDYGGRIDVEWRYGKNEHLGFSARLGAGTGFGGQSTEAMAPPPPFSFFIDPSLGVQTAIPLGVVTPAIRAELGLYSYWGPGPALWPSVMLGFGRSEFLTAGTRMKLAWGMMPYAWEAFLGIHPASQFSIFGGVELMSIFDEDMPLLGTTGIGIHF